MLRYSATSLRTFTTVHTASSLLKRLSYTAAPLNLHQNKNILLQNSTNDNQFLVIPVCSAPSRFCATTHTTNTPTTTHTTPEPKTGEPDAKRPISVYWAATPNADSWRFYSMELSFLPPGCTLDLPNEGHAYKSPLAELLFKQCAGIASIYISDEYITITKEPSADWDDVTAHVRSCIIEFAHSGYNILSDEGEAELKSGNQDTEPQPGDTEVVLAIKELLHTRIRPMLAMDGGGMRYVAFEDGLVYLVLEGACKTCSSKGNTLKIGIERMLMHWIPEVAEVVEVDEMWAEDYQRQFELEQTKIRQEKESSKSSESTDTVGGAEKKEQQQ